MSPNQAVFVTILLLLFPMTGAVFLIRAGLRPPRRGTTPHCRRCDYNVTGITTGRCPECGLNLTDRDILLGQADPSVLRIAGGILCFALSAAGVLRSLYALEWYSLRPTAWV